MSYSIALTVMIPALEMAKKIVFDIEYVSAALEPASGSAATTVTT